MVQLSLDAPIVLSKPETGLVQELGFDVRLAASIRPTSPTPLSRSKIFIYKYIKGYIHIEF